MIRSATRLAAIVLPLAVASVALSQTTATASNNNVGLPRYPSVSPDGSSVVFAWRGDLWRVATQGGHARRLTANASEDNYSVWSPDGSQIAFTSERNGGGNIFLMNADGSDVHAVSQTDRYFVVTGWNANDGLTLNARLENDWFPSLRSYALSPEGGEATRLFDAFGSQPIVSPDGSKILFNRGGFQWSRRGYMGPDARDVWVYDRATKTYMQVTKWAGNDGRAKWRNDSTIIYASDREDGTVNLYALELGKDESTAKRLTNANGTDIEEFDISRDGKTLVFASWDRLHRIALGDLASKPIATAIDITADEDTNALVTYRAIDRNVSESALSPDGKTMAVIAFGQVYVRGTEKNATARRVNPNFGRCNGLEWSPDGSTLFYSSDEDPKLGSAIYAATVTLSRSDVKKSMGVSPTTSPSDASATGASQGVRRRPTVRPTAPGEMPVDEDINQAATQAAPEPSMLPGDPTTVPSDVPPVTPIGGTSATPSEPTTSPASQPATMATTSPTTEPTTSPTTASATQPATTTAAEPNLAARWPDALRFDVRMFISDPDRISVGDASLSPDGTQLAYQRGVGKLIIRDLATGNDRVLVDGWSESLEWRWSPDSKLIAYVTEDRNNNADIFIVPADASAKPINISKHPDNDYSPRWSADGKVLAFLSDRNENEADVYSVFLDRGLESLQGVDLDAYYREAAEKAKKRERPKKRPTTMPATSPTTTPATAAAATSSRVEQRIGRLQVQADMIRSQRDSAAESIAKIQAREANDTPALRRVTAEFEAAEEQLRAAEKLIDSLRAKTNAVTTTQSAATTTATSRPAEVLLDLDDAYLRLRRLTNLPGSEGNLEIAPAGDKFIFTGSGAGGGATYILDRDAPEPRRLAAPVDVQALTFEGDKAVITESGRAATLNLASGAIEGIDVSDRLPVDGRKLNEQKFREAVRIMGATYYDETMNGLDWPAVSERYLKLIQKTLTADEFDHVANKLLGELNGSHLGIRVPDAVNPNAVNNGRLGIITKRVEDGDQITKVYDNGPSSKGTFKLEPNDVIVAVEGVRFDPKVPHEAMFANRAGKETLVTVKRGGKEIDLLLTPISAEAEAALAYDQWRREMADKVSKLSDGKLGYIHIRGMDQGSLDVFERDLFAAADGKEGLVIDVRNNGGGWTTDRLLASIMYPQHAYTRPRGDKSGATDSYPQDRLFIQRYNLPINMLCNEKSFSNAEIVSHAFKNLKRGTLVGQQTAGGVISTGGTSLLDGTTVRLPGRGWFTMDGTNMEMNGAMPDLVVPQTPEAEAREEDEQLKVAVEDLMKRTAATRPTSQPATR